MSYLALARKWRPRNFSELAGQEHVMRALVNALETGRVHHAFLFTGTRGVGKTTIARILAKSLNCETGVTPTPCGKCSACREIDEGRFVDLIEVDAASRTKVDDTRELLDNVQYSPARGRYKVYLIDEVHMLSTHSFNALLKTLEEPPPHVKFLLATTDPQKLPVTVLSRCLQFNLKRFPPGLIYKRLTEIAQAEKLEFEADALRLVARAAEGSMRDALSLLDQVIAFGGMKLTAADTRMMLGTLDRTQVFEIVEALVARDAKKVLACVEALDERAPDYREVLADLAALLQKLALLQAVPDCSSTRLKTSRLTSVWRQRSARKMRSCSIRSPSSVVATWSLHPMCAADSRWSCCACWRSESRTAHKRRFRSRQRRSRLRCRYAKPPAAAAPDDCEGVVCDGRADEPARHGQGARRAHHVRRQAGQQGAAGARR